MVILSVRQETESMMEASIVEIWSISLNMAKIVIGKVESVSHKLQFKGNSLGVQTRGKNSGYIQHPNGIQSQL